MKFHFTRQLTASRGLPPVAFLAELVEWGRKAPAEIFAPRPGYDVYSSVVNNLGPYRDDMHRRAVMLEVLRVLAGFESSWRWDEGRDVSNPASDTPAEIEAGAWQVSADSMAFGADLRELVLKRAGATDPHTFQRAMKEDHELAMEYAARLLRHTTRHNGPLRDRALHPHLRPMAAEEFLQLLTPTETPA